MFSLHIVHLKKTKKLLFICNHLRVKRKIKLWMLQGRKHNVNFEVWIFFKCKIWQSMTVMCATVNKFNLPLHESKWVKRNESSMNVHNLKIFCNFVKCKRSHFWFGLSDSNDFTSHVINYPTEQILLLTLAFLSLQSFFCFSLNCIITLQCLQ